MAGMMIIMMIRSTENIMMIEARMKNQPVPFMVDHYRRKARETCRPDPEVYF